MERRVHAQAHVLELGCRSLQARQRNGFRTEPILWNETSFTENAFWVDGKREKVDTVHLDYDSNDLFRPWRMTSSDGKVDLLFYPERTRSERRNALVLASRFTQLMGFFQGNLMTREGKRIEVDNCYGWTEDHYAKW